MTRRITPQTTLDNLKKEAKRWLKELRASEADARARFVRAYPNAPQNPGLRDVQHAIAREFELTGWPALKQALENRPAIEASTEDAQSRLVAQFIEYACPDHHVRGRPAHRIARHAAKRLIEQHPEIARDSIYTAVICGEIDEVDRILRDRPQAASEKSAIASKDRSDGGVTEDIFKDIGPKGWEPLLYLCFTRLPLQKANDNAIAIARMLLDNGANPNSFFMAGNSRYTPLVGVIGEGEEDRPPHPQREALARLLLERGAEPYDIQVVYNIHFHGKILWYLKLMYEFSVKAGRKADWEDPEWHMLDMGNYGSGARWHLWTAVQENDLELAEWCLNHGANPNSAPPRDQRFLQRTLYEEAQRFGNMQMAELLARYGAARSPVEPELEDAFVAACLRLDEAEAKRLLGQHPEYLRSQEAMLAAVRPDRAEVVEFLIGLGLSIEFEYENKRRPLHIAANHDAVRVAELLIRRGAQIDPVEETWKNTPIDFAVWHEHPHMIDLLGRYTRDLGNLVFIGNVARLRELLGAEPELAKMNWGSTPLFWLPEDERKAVEIVDLFVSLGADAGFRRKDDDRTAADVARRRGLLEAARRLEAAAATAPSEDVSSGSAEVVKYERLANDMVTAYDTGDADAMQRVRDHYRLPVTVEDLRAMVWRLIYKVRQAKGASHAFSTAEARELIARTSGFNNWSTLKEAVAKGASSPIPPYEVDANKIRIRPRRHPTDKEWDAIIAIMKEQRITAVDAHGFMNDAVLSRIADLDHVTELDLGGSRQLTDEGLQSLAKMPQLQRINLSEYPGGKLTDRALEVLRHLPNLRMFEMTWQKGISDAGIANLRFCEKLESVNLMGTPTGDGAIEALRGKPKLWRLDTGKQVTDAGLALLHEFPRFKTWHDDNGPVDAALNEDYEPTHLLIDGPFTNKGLAHVTALHGVYALDLFWHVTGITSEGFEALAQLPNLASLGCDGRLSDDEAMRHIGSIPRLRKLRAQGTVATDDGFIALSRSRSLEKFWGRECPNLTGRGFVALSKMPALRSLGVSCKNVDDEALSSLPRFPALQQLTPIDVQDEGFRHVGRCVRLQHLQCMYCRDTTDVATEHIAGLQIKTYYAGLTKITDRSLQILGGMLSLESIELYETKGVTDAGLVYLAGLPRLREIHLGELPNVTLAGTKIFPPHVRVNYEV